MKTRFSSVLLRFGVPLACVLALALRLGLPRQRTPDAIPPPVLHVACAPALTVPLRGIADAFQRRHGIRIVLADHPSPDLRIQEIPGNIPDVDPDGAPIVAHRAGILYRAELSETLEADELVQAFIQFLQRSSAREHFHQHGFQ